VIHSISCDLDEDCTCALEGNMNLGYRPDPYDHRDKIFAGARSSVAMATDLVVLPITTPVSMQSNISSCVANATADATELLAGRGETGIVTVSSLAAARAFLNDDIDPPIQLSRLYLYFLARLSHGEECIDEGTYVRSAFQVLRNQGVCTESAWPYNIANVFVRPPLSALEEGYDHRISQYGRIQVASARYMGEQVRMAIDAGLPVVHGKDVGNEYLDAFGVSDDVCVGPPRISLGGHATVIVGYRRMEDGSHQYLDRNSHGSRYGLRSCPGHIWISELYLGTARDLWVAEEIYAP